MIIFKSVNFFIKIDSVSILEFQFYENLLIILNLKFCFSTVMEFPE